MILPTNFSEEWDALGFEHPKPGTIHAGTILPSSQHYIYPSRQTGTLCVCTLTGFLKFYTQQDPN